MQNKYSKKQLEELYNCIIFKDFGFDDSYLFWVAQGLPLQKMVMIVCLYMQMVGI